MSRTDLVLQGRKRSSRGAMFANLMSLATGQEIHSLPVKRLCESSVLEALIIGQDGL